MPLPHICALPLSPAALLPAHAPHAALAALLSALPQEYKEAVVISAPADPEEAEHNRLIRERLTAGLLASTSGAGKGGKGRGKGCAGMGTAAGAARILCWQLRDGRLPKFSCRLLTLQGFLEHRLSFACWLLNRPLSPFPVLVLPSAGVEAVGAGVAGSRQRGAATAVRRQGLQGLITLLGGG